MLAPRPSAARARRDASLRRLRWCNRSLAAGMVALTVFLANAGARSFPGHARATGAVALILLTLALVVGVATTGRGQPREATSQRVQAEN